MRRRDFLNTAMLALSAGFTSLPVAARNKHRATGYIRTNWSRDPYSLGSYSYVAKGARRRDHVALGKPIGKRLFFAGEATHADYNSTVHAAYESGQIAAEAIYNGTNAESIAIIGAGVSGLSAATWLAQEGYEVTIFEARDRIGGRVWTDRSLGLPLDLGASWIHGIDGNPIAHIASELSVGTHVTDESYAIRGGDGRKMSEAEAPDWLDNVVSVQHSLGADEDEVNGASYSTDSDYEGDEVILPGGYDQVLGAMPRSLDIRFGSVLSQVNLNQEGVLLRDTAGRQAIFDAVVLTVPLGVLKQGSIDFLPPLPEWKSKAITRLAMGLLDKVYLRYAEVFWDRDVTWIVTPENGFPRGQFNQWLNLYRYTGQPVIMALNGAQPARDLSGLSDAEIVQRAEQTLRRAYP